MSVYEDEDTREEAAAVSAFAPPPKITVDTQPPLHETLWRCTVCGKWSHAKRRPKHHERSTMDPADDDTILRSEQYNDPFGSAVLYWIACGPFEKWEAWKVESP